MQLTKKMLLGVAALAAVSASSVEAQQVRFAGNVFGCFYGNGSLGNLGGSCAPVSGPISLGGLTYSAAAFSPDFDVYTDPAGLSGVSYGSIGSNDGSQSLGRIQAAAGDFAYNGYFLRLQISFTTPDLIDPPASTSFDGQTIFKDLRITGSTGSGASFGGVNFNPACTAINPFGCAGDPTAALFGPANAYTGSYQNGQVFGGGTASGEVNYFNVDRVSLTNTEARYLGAFFEINSTVTSVPEPATVALMATGLVGILGAGFVRRRSV